MPCNSDYMNPTYKEKLLQETAQFYLYTLSELRERGFLELLPSHKVDFTQLVKASRDIYCSDDYVADLCLLLTDLKMNHVEIFDLIVYNSRDKTARKLADWWEEHEAADAARKRELEEDERNYALVRQAAAKLTEEEIAAINDRYGVTL